MSHPRSLVLSRTGLVGRAFRAQPAGTPFFPSFIKNILFPFKTQLCWLVMGLGVALRCGRYLENRSLWLDEALLALNIVPKTFAELLQPLDYRQAAPIGFLLIEKLSVHLLGNSEFALRLFPFLCGVASLLLFYQVGRRCLPPMATLIGLSLFAISGPLLYYSSEVKQYSSDVMIALLLYVMALPYVERERLSLGYAVLFGAVGALGIWFSHPAVFVLAGIGTTLALLAFFVRDWERIGQLLVVGTLWVLSFAGAYFSVLEPLSRNEFFVNGFRSSFMPLVPQATGDIRWFAEAAWQLVGLPLGPAVPLAALACIVGGYILLTEKKSLFFLLIAPIVFTLVASGLHKYPFSGRLILFLTPSLLLVIAIGAARVWQVSEKQVPLLGVAFVGFLLLVPLLSSGPHGFSSRAREEIKPLLSYFADRRQEGDLLYVYYGAHPALHYYQERYGVTNKDYIVGVSPRGDWNGYRDDLAQLRGNKRVWVLFSHVRRPGGVDEEKLGLYFLDNMGVGQDRQQAAGATLYLYDLATPRDERAD